MRIAFMGTPDFSVPILHALVAGGHEVAAVYTQPPRPAGRGRQLRASPVSEAANRLGLEVRHPENFKADEQKQAFSDLNLDVAVVVAYGLILPKAILAAPVHGCLNLHASLLPRWRGAAPIHRAIMAGDQQTGIQVMQMEAGLDTGPVLLGEALAILPSDTTSLMHDKLSQAGAQIIIPALAALERGSLVASPQSNEGVCYAEKISADEASIDWGQPARLVDCHIRGLSAFPGAWFMAPGNDGKPLRIKALFSSLVDAPFPEGIKPGTILRADEKLYIACADGAVALEQLQRPGKAVQAVDVFLRGMALREGQELAVI